MKHKAHFYSHLVSFEEVLIELDTLELSPDEKHHLGQLMDSNLHHTVLDAILAELKELNDQWVAEALVENVVNGLKASPWLLDLFASFLITKTVPTLGDGGASKVFEKLG